MKKFLFLCLILSASLELIAQDPVNTNVVTKRVVKVKGKFFVETSTATVTYMEMTKEMLFDIERDDSNEAADAADVERVKAEKETKKAERIERNRLLKQALKQGYNPPVLTLEEKAKIEALKAKILK